MKTFLFPFGLLFWLCNSYAQDTSLLVQRIDDSISITYALQGRLTDPSGINFKKRQRIIGGLSAAAYAGSLVLLNEAWYKGYPKAPFHTYNDAGEWLQVDKVGHAWTAYNASRATTALWQWAGLPHQKRVLLGSVTGFTYLSVIEILDAHSAEWGWSWADMGANFLGASLFAAQDLAWKEQKIQFKFSGHKKRYDPQLRYRANSLFGATLPERLLKDYNGQTYWASFNVKGILNVSCFPGWLNMAVGYGADGLWGGFENKAYDALGNVAFDRSDIRRRRQWYLSPDVDLTKIHTNKKWVKTLLFAFNVLKVPAPALRYSGGRFRFHPVFF